MKILFYRYGSICEPDIMEAMEHLGHEVSSINLEITNKNIPAQEVIKHVSEALLGTHFDAVFSINFYPVLSEICNIMKLPYVCWTVDSPIMELYSDSYGNEWNRIFLFDSMQYQDFAPYNPDHTYYLPLATNVSRWDSVLSDSRPDSFSGDISFVGSLYTEKCPYDALTNPSPYLSGYLNGIMDAQEQIYGAFLLPELLPDPVVKEFIDCMPDYYIPPEKARRSDRDIIAQKYLGMKVTVNERKHLLSLLGSHFSVDLYTFSNTTGLSVHNHGRVKTLTEMPQVFAHSKINLNMTCKSIRNGIPLRVFDVLGCGGFLLTNYQNDLNECFTIGEDLVIYTSPDDLLNKCEYYLSHEKERKGIAENGYQKVLNNYTYEKQIEKILAQL